MKRKSTTNTTRESPRKFKAGAIVRLNIGGPDLSVRSYVRKCVACCWWVHHILKEAVFHEDQLVASGPRIIDLELLHRFHFVLSEAKKQREAELLEGSNAKMQTEYKDKG